MSSGSDMSADGGTGSMSSDGGAGSMSSDGGMGSMSSDGGMSMSGDGGAMSGMSGSMNSAQNSMNSGMNSMSDAGNSAMGSAQNSMNSGMSSASGSATTAADAAKNAGSSAGSMASGAADAGMAAMGSAADAGTSGSSGSNLSDAQIAGITAAAHKGEIDAAKMARKQSKNAKVKAFAAQMVKQHTSAMKMETDVASKAGITPADSDMSAKITQMNSDTASQLQGLKGAEFDKAYVQAQVDAHTKVLDMLDNQLIPAAQNADLKAQLTKERSVVATHLEHAKKLAASMGGSQ
jgi:putative membrane protein